MTEHEPWCRMKMVSHSDAAKRMCDTYNLHRLAYGTLGLDSIGKWFAVRLADGDSDRTLYDTKRDAIIHQHHNEQHYAFVCVKAPSMNVCEAELFMATQRKFADAGLRMIDPDDRHGGREVITRLTVEDQMAAMRGYSTGLIWPGKGM